MTHDRFTASLRAILIMSLAASVPAHAAPPQSGTGKPAASNPDVSRVVQSVQATSGTPAASAGIVFVDVTPDTIVTIRTAQNVITRVALPEEAKEAICGDLFDAASNTGSFVINKSGNDVFIKPVNSKSQTNLFVKTETSVYNFDLVVVPSAQAHRVVNVNLPSHTEEIEQLREAARREIAAERTEMEADMAKRLADRQEELDKQAQATLAADQRKLRAEADRRANELATRRIVDGVMQGFQTVTMRERRAEGERIDLLVDDVAYIFEGRLYVRYRITNKSSRDLTFSEPRVLIRNGERDRPVATTVVTARGDYVVPGGSTIAGVAIFEMPNLENLDRLYLAVRAEGQQRPVQLRLVE
jgi:Skp family chaperone for outer membrane proteins